MSDSRSSKWDKRFDRLSKVEGIFLSLVVALVGGIYTFRKDQNDKKTRDAQTARDDYQRNWDNTQKQYANLTALLPLLTSSKPSEVSTGLEIYQSEANAYQAPLDLLPTIRRIQNEQPLQSGAAQVAIDAAKNQMQAECKANPDGLYIHVANNDEQLERGRQLATLLRSAGFKVQGVQRVDAVPDHTQLRFYFSNANSAQANKVIAELSKHGFVGIEPQDLSARYLKQECPAPAVFELWIGKATPLGAANASIAK